MANFTDPEDGELDVSGFLSRGGLVPVPIIITGPAVERGLGIPGEFIHEPTSPGAPPGRTIIGGVITGNASKAGGLLHQGAFVNGRLIYRLML